MLFDFVKEWAARVIELLGSLPLEHRRPGDPAPAGAGGEQRFVQVSFEARASLSARVTSSTRGFGVSTD
jgi:hypothetical protein